MAGGAVATRLSGIEIGRGLAATAVVLYHAARHLNQAHSMPTLTSVFQFGHAGVDFFFVISGFIIVYVHYKDIGKPDRLGHYVGRRITRVMPTYWVALAITIAMRASGSRGMPSLTDIAWSASLLPSDHELLLGVAWTLQYEIVFYAVFCVLILHRAAGLTLLLLWLGVVVAATATHADIAGVPMPFYGICNLEFFFGMCAAYVVREHTVPAPKALLVVGVIFFATAAVAENFGVLDGYANFARFAYGLPSMLIVLGLAGIGMRGELTGLWPLRVLGSASYSVYLFQFVFIGTVWQLWLAAGLDRSLPLGASYPILVASAVAGGIAMSRWVENPLIRLSRSGSILGRAARTRFWLGSPSPRNIPPT